MILIEANKEILYIKDSLGYCNHHFPGYLKKFFWKLFKGHQQFQVDDTIFIVNDTHIFAQYNIAENSLCVSFPLIWRPFYSYMYHVNNRLLRELIKNEIVNHFGFYVENLFFETLNYD